MIYIAENVGDGNRDESEDESDAAWGVRSVDAGKGGVDALPHLAKGAACRPNGGRAATERKSTPPNTRENPQDATPANALVFFATATARFIGSATA